MTYENFYVEKYNMQEGLKDIIKKVKKIKLNKLYKQERQ